MASMTTANTSATPSAEPSGPVFVSVQPAGSSSTHGENDGSISIRMGKQTLGIIVAALIGSSALGGGIATGVSDKKLDERVGAALGDALDRKLDGKMKETREAALSAAKEAATQASAATTAQITSLRDLVVQQGATTTASAQVEQQTRQRVEQMLNDHEDRLRYLERTAPPRGR